MSNRLILIIVTGLIISGCAGKEAPESKAHPAAFVTDIFGIDNGMPIREVQKKEFYFKKCELETRRPFPNRIEYECVEK